MFVLKECLEPVKEWEEELKTFQLRNRGDAIRTEALLFEQGESQVSTIQMKAESLKMVAKRKGCHY